MTGSRGLNNNSTFDFGDAGGRTPPVQTKLMGGAAGRRPDRRN